jgi:hypothetical protein
MDWRNFNVENSAHLIGFEFSRAGENARVTMHVARSECAWNRYSGRAIAPENFNAIPASCFNLYFIGNFHNPSPQFGLFLQICGSWDDKGVDTAKVVNHPH